jgi:hypothetical protein
MTTEEELSKARARMDTLLKLIGDRGVCSGADCGAQIVWVRLKDGKPHPVNPDGSSHFSTCVNAIQFRRKK